MAVLLITATAIGCSAKPDRAALSDATSTTARQAVPTTTTVIPGATFAAGVRQFRSDEVAKVMHVELENLTAAPIRVGSVQLSWAGLAEVAPSAPDYTTHPGVVVALEMDYGAGRCPAAGEPPTSTRGAVVRVTGTAADGSAVSTDVAVTRYAETLERIQKVQCDNQAVADVVDVALVGPWTETTTADGRPAATGRVAVSPVGDLDERVVLVSIVGAGVLVDLETLPPGRTPMADLAPGDGPVEVPVAVVGSARCDGHALGEDKKTYDMYATVEVDGTQHYADLAFALDDRPTVWRVVTRTCGVATG